MCVYSCIYLYITTMKIYPMYHLLCARSSTPAEPHEVEHAAELAAQGLANAV